MKRRNILSLLLLVAFSVSSLFMSSFGATAELSSGLNGDVASDWISYGAEHIEGTRRISAVTGAVCHNRHHGAVRRWRNRPRYTVHVHV